MVVAQWDANIASCSAEGRTEFVLLPHTWAFTPSSSSLASRSSRLELLTKAPLLWVTRPINPALWAQHQTTLKDLGWTWVHLQSRQKLTVKYISEEAHMQDSKMVFFLDFSLWTNDHGNILYFHRVHVIAWHQQDGIGLLFSETSHLIDIHTGHPEKKPQASCRLCLTLLKWERQN